MAIYVQYGKVGKPILYSTLPTASADLNGVIGQVGNNVYQCDGTQWVALASSANLQDKSVTITQNGTTEITADSGYDGMSKVNINTNVPSTPTEEKTVALDMASGNQVVNPTSGKVLNKVTITKPSTLIASNIKSGVNIAGVSGSLSPAKPEQAKSTTITENGTTTVAPDSGKVLSSVSITTNVPTYITVASESALPSTAQEGTIAVVEG